MSMSNGNFVLVLVIERCLSSNRWRTNAANVKHVDVDECATYATDADASRRTTTSVANATSTHAAGLSYGAW